MKNSDIEKMLAGAFQKIEPDQLSAVLSECEKQERKVVQMNGNKKERRMPKLIWSLGVCAAAIALLLGGTWLISGKQAAATIGIDVNPSMEIRIDRNEKVLGVDALNEDAETVIGDTDFKGTNLDVTVNALIGSLVRNGYIGELSNSVLISVQGKDQAQGQVLEQDLLDEISALLENGSVMSQQVQADDELKSIAAEYGISLGKAQLVRRLADSSDLYTYADLAGLSINELNLLNKRDDSGIVRRLGTPTDKAYIGLDTAIRIALKHAGANNESKVYVDEAGLDTEKGVMVYEVEFRYEGTEYDYTIDAVTGNVLSAAKEAASGGKTGNTGVPNVDGVISQDEAKRNALAHAGIAESQVSGLTIELEYDDGMLKYDISFTAGGTEYEYDIDAKTGAVLIAEMEAPDDDDLEDEADEDEDDIDDIDDDLDGEDDDDDDLYDRDEDDDDPEDPDDDDDDDDDRDDEDDD